MEEQNQVPVAQALEDQSIFVLLGIMNGTDDEREDFLDRLQKTIWDDFLDNDVELLLTEEEVKPLIEIINDAGLGEDAKQEKMASYLQELIPDLEGILMEKALKLKEDLVRERHLSLEQLSADKPEKMEELGQIRDLMSNSQWAEVGARLNSFVL